MNHRRLPLLSAIAFFAIFGVAACGPQADTVTSAEYYSCREGFLYERADVVGSEAIYREVTDKGHPVKCVRTGDASMATVEPVDPMKVDRVD